MTCVLTNETQTKTRFDISFPGAGRHLVPSPRQGVSVRTCADATARAVKGRALGDVKLGKRYQIVRFDVHVIVFIMFFYVLGVFF